MPIVYFVRSKTVTWADDPHNNYKKEDQTQFYEAQNTANDNSVPDETYYANNTEESQQFQSEYSPQANMQGIEPNPSNYQYDGNQYQAQTNAEANQNVYTNEEYYYPDEQAAQYEQYESESQQQQQQPQQQVQILHMINRNVEIKCSTYQCAKHWKGKKIEGERFAALALNFRNRMKA